MSKDKIEQDVRCFVALKIPEDIVSEIVKIQEGLPEFFGKITEKENLHLTLKFLGEIPLERVEQVKKKLGEIKFEKFNARINRLGVFSEKFVRIIWLHLLGCEKFQKIVDEKLAEMGFGLEKRFMSHLTIARVKSLNDKKKFLEDFKKIEIKGSLEWSVDNFYLIKSELHKKGPVYSVLEEYSLD
jgi:RNA 2',3'-cyclic 3'-phosphodiesterase